MPEMHAPPWRGGGWGPPGPRPGPGRRFRRGGLVVLALLVLIVAGLASLVGAIASGNAPAPGITIAVSAVVLVALALSARWFWATTRSVGALMDAADRVARGEYGMRAGHVPSRQLQRLADSFDEMTGRLETNEARRRELLADIAHELRTPLQAIHGSVEGMLDGLYPADAAHLRSVIERTDMMARLLEDLRTLSMAESGVLELHREPVDPLAAARGVADAVRPVAGTRGVSIEVEASDGSPASVEADPTRLDEILANLVTNAFQHTPAQGRITVTVGAGPEGGASYTIDDTGPGIPPDQRARVFERFVTSADSGGTGLGLAIARRLVEAHGGSIEAGAAPGGGTRIRFVLP
jgi:signal transduction histidine kinase